MHKIIFILALSIVFIFGSTHLAAKHHGEKKPLPAAFMELINESMTEKVGITFFLNGQALPAVVTKIIDAHTIEGRSQQYGRIIIRLHRVNAIARQ